MVAATELSRAPWPATPVQQSPAPVNTPLTVLHPATDVEKQTKILTAIYGLHCFIALSYFTSELYALVLAVQIAAAPTNGYPGAVPAGTIFILVYNALAVLTFMVLLIRFSGLSRFLERCCCPKDW